MLLCPVGHLLIAFLIDHVHCCLGCQLISFPFPVANPTFLPYLNPNIHPCSCSNFLQESFTSHSKLVWNIDNIRMYNWPYFSNVPVFGQPSLLSAAQNYNYVPRQLDRNTRPPVMGHGGWAAQASFRSCQMMNASFTSQSNTDASVNDQDTSMITASFSSTVATECETSASGQQEHAPFGFSRWIQWPGYALLSETMTGPSGACNPQRSKAVPWRCQESAPA